MKLSLERTVLAAIALALCLILTALAGRAGANDRTNRMELLLLVQQLGMGASIVAAESRSLLHDGQSLNAIQQANDYNIDAYQLLINGSIKRNLPSLDSLLGEVPESFAPRIETFQATVAELIQSRTLLEGLQQGKGTLIQTAERMVTQSESLADGLEQQSNNIDHLRAAYRIKTALITHAQAVRQAYADNGGAPAFPIEALSQDLQSLSTATTAPGSPTLRRTAANLLNQLEEYQQQLKALEQHNQATLKLQTMQSTLQQQTRLLQQQMDMISAALYGITPWGIYLAIALGCLSLGNAIWLGYLIRHRKDIPVVIDTSALAPVTHNDRTGPTFMTQLKTEKNLLMNDIKPIGEGILYIKADEHLESTGDLARCLNQSREALVRRIEQLKRQVADLQEAFDNTRIPEQAPGNSAPLISPDKSLLIDLTYKGHAELDGLQRHLRNQTNLGQDLVKQLMVRCLKAERVLDEIRVRLKKADSGVGEGQAPSPLILQTSMPMEQVRSMVSSLVEHLEEFQTQPVKGRRARNLAPMQ